MGGMVELTLFVEEFSLMMGNQSINHGADVPVNETVQIVTGQVDAMVRDAALGKL